MDFGVAVSGLKRAITDIPNDKKAEAFDLQAVRGLLAYFLDHMNPTILIEKQSLPIDRYIETDVS